MGKKEKLKELIRNINYAVLTPCFNCSNNQFRCKKLENKTCVQFVEWMKLQDALNELFNEAEEYDFLDEILSGKIQKVYALTAVYSDSDRTVCKLYDDKYEAFEEMNDLIVKDIEIAEEKQGFTISNITRAGKQVTLIFNKDNKEEKMIHYCIHRVSKRD